jgi:hypothetical protein
MSNELFLANAEALEDGEILTGYLSYNETCTVIIGNVPHAGSKIECYFLCGLSTCVRTSCYPY